MSDHQAFILKVRQWIAVHANAGSGTVKARVDEASMRLFAKEYCEIVGPVASMVNRCVAWEKVGLFIETCSVCDDYPDLLEVAKELLFQDALASGGGSTEIARLMLPFAPTGIAIPIIEKENVFALERAYGERDRTAGMVASVQNLALSRASVPLRVAALRKLFRDNPGSNLWQNEIRRIEGGAFDWVQLQMTKAHQEGDFEAAKALMKELDRTDWGVPVPEGVRASCTKLWKNLLGREAEKRYGELERAIRDASSASDSEKLAELERGWCDVANDTGHEPSREGDAAVQPAFEWLNAERERVRREREFGDAIRAVEDALSSRASESTVSRCYRDAQGFDREIPIHVSQGVERFHEAIRLHHRRRTRVLVAGCVAAVLVLAGFVAWMVHRDRVRTEVKQLVELVEVQLKEHRIPEAEKLLADQPTLAGEVDVAAIHARVIEARPQWEKDRAAFQAWKMEVDEACAKPFSQAKFDGFEKTIAAMQPLLMATELTERDTLLAKAKTAVATSVASRREELKPKSTAFLAGSTAILTLDQMPESSRYAPVKLSEVRDGIAPLILTGNAIISEFSDIGAEHCASIGTEIARIAKISVEAVSRLKAIEDFQSALKSLAESYTDLQEFKRKYDAIVEDSKAVLVGLSLRDDFKDGVELTIALDAALAWSNLVGNRPERLHFWDASDPPAPGDMESLEEFLESHPDSDIEPQVRVLLSIGQRAVDREGNTAAERVVQRIKDSGASELCAIPLEKGGPVFRKRSPKGDTATNPWTDGMVWTRADLESAWDELPAADKLKRRLYAQRGIPGDCPASATIRGRLETFTKANTLASSRQILRRLIGEVAAGQSTDVKKQLDDPLARLWCVLELMNIWDEELVIDETSGVDLAFAATLKEIESKYPELLDYDWVEPRMEAGEIARRTVFASKAREVLMTISELPTSGSEDADLFARIASSLKRLDVVGVVSVDPFTHDCSLIPATGLEARELFILVRRTAGAFEFVPFKASELREFLQQNISPHATLLVFANPLEKKSKGGRK